MTSFSPQTIGLIIGGLLPALVYGVSVIFTKASIQSGIGIGLYLVIIGLSISLTGAVYYLFEPDSTFSLRAGGYAFAFGITWGIATGLIAIVLARFHTPLSQLIPLYNMNTLIGVLLALWIFAEWRQVHVPTLLMGSILIVAGGVLVARA